MVRKNIQILVFAMADKKARKPSRSTPSKQTDAKISSPIPKKTAKINDLIIIKAIFKYAWN